MDHLFEFTNDLTKEFFRLVTQEGVTSYDEDDGKLATLAVKNVLAGRDFTMVATAHYKELLDGQWIGEPAVLHDILDKYSALMKADDEGDCESIALDAIADELSRRGCKVVRAEHYSKLISARVLPGPRVFAKIVDRYNKTEAESPGADHPALAMDAIRYVLAHDDKLVVSSQHLAELNAKADPEEPRVVVIDKQGQVTSWPENVIVNDYRAGSACMSCGKFFLFISDGLRLIGPVYTSGVLVKNKESYVCDDCGPEDNSIPF